jgi:hypothetical protein
MRTSLSEVLNTSITVSIRDSVDPLKKFVILEIGDPLSKGNWNPFQVMVHAFAKANDCVIASIRKETPKRLVMETLTKTRLGPEEKKDPFLIGDKGSPPKKEA